MADQHPIPKLMVLSKTLRRHLTEKKLKITELSRATRVPVQTLSNWLEGQTPRNLNQLKAVADYLKVSVDKLLFDSEPTLDLLKQHESEIHAGIYEVVLRRIKHKE